MNGARAGAARCPDCAALQARVVELELRYMDLEQQLEELSALVRRQDDQLDQLGRALQASLDEGDDDGGSAELL